MIYVYYIWITNNVLIGRDKNYDGGNRTNGCFKVIFNRFYELSMFKGKIKFFRKLEIIFIMLKKINLYFIGVIHK